MKKPSGVKLTREQLKKHLCYNPDTGLFTRLIVNSNSVKVGDIAGQEHQGYIRIQVVGIRRMAHCFAWLYMTGEWPNGEIDHKDGNRSNNIWDNLRLGTHSLNQQNLRKARVTSTTGKLGVCRMGRKFQAVIRVNGKKRFLGTFLTPDLAHEAYLSAKRKFHAGCTI